MLLLTPLHKVINKFIIHKFINKKGVRGNVLIIALIITLIGLFVMLFYYRRSNKENYTSLENNRHLRDRMDELSDLAGKVKLTLSELIQQKTYDPTLLQNDKTITFNDKYAMNRIKGDYDLDDITTAIIDSNPSQEIDWKNVYVDSSKTNNNILNVIPKDPTPEIISFSRPSNFLESAFREDVCEKYRNDYNTLEEKCNNLSPENCKVPSCCVLLNGSKCVAGDMNGPIFLTEEGITIDYQYYYNKNKCYGNCGIVSNYDIECGIYSENSTNVSKECMIEMFNKYGCPNKTPNALINDEMVTNHSETTREYVEKFIKDAAYVLLPNRDAESIELCNGVRN